MTAFGGKLTLRGAQVVHGGAIEMPAGTVRLEATGPGAQDGVTLAGGSVIDVKAVKKDFFDQAAYASAGTVDLIAASGSAVVAGGAVVDLSAPAAGNAGRLTVTVPNGVAVLAGDIRASAAANAVQGSFVLDAGALPDFGTLMAVLNAAGFFEQRHLAVRSGDIVLDGTTQTNHLQVVADAGSIRVRGGTRLIADGANGGDVRLVARGDLVLESGALISARGTTGKGGRIDLEAAQGSLDFAAGSLLDVSGATLGGKVHARALRSGETVGTIKASRLASTVIGASSATAEAYWVYENVSTIDRTVIDQVANAANVFMAQVPARLGHFDLAAGIELRSSGDMTLAADWDLHTTRPGGKPGYLTLRAAGTLRLDQSLSDGFDGVTSSAKLLGDDSWSYRLVGGARLGGANVFALRQPAELAVADTGDVVAGADAIIRTGTGDIDIAAGRNMVMERKGATDQILFNPNNASDVVHLSEAIASDGLSLLAQYKNWYVLDGGFNYIYDPNNPSAGAVDLFALAGTAPVFRADGKLNTTYRGWRSISGLDLIYNPANPSQKVHFFDAFDADGVLMPAYRGWKSLSSNDSFTAGFTAKWRAAGGNVTDMMSMFLPSGKVDLRYLGFFVKAGTTDVVCRLLSCTAGNTANITDVVDADGNIKAPYQVGSWRVLSISNNPKMTIASTTPVGTDREATIYTAGRLSDAGTLAVVSAVSAATYSGTINFAERGGNLTIAAQGDVRGAKLSTHSCSLTSASGCVLQPTINRQFVADWLLRRAGGIDSSGNVVTSAWGVDYSKFKQGLGTLGGGDVTITAGGSISTLAAVASDNGKASNGTLATWGGGDLTVSAGGDADANLFYVANGAGRISVGGSMGIRGVLDGSRTALPVIPVATMLALGRGGFDIEARGDIHIGGMFNPTMVGMEGPLDATPGGVNGTYFSTYAPDSALTVQSLGGEVVMSSIPAAAMMNLSTLYLGLDRSYGTGAMSFFFYAPQVRVVSMQGDITVGRDYRPLSSASGRMTLFPAPNGNLDDACRKGHRPDGKCQVGCQQRTRQQYPGLRRRSRSDARCFQPGHQNV